MTAHSSSYTGKNSQAEAKTAPMDTNIPGDETAGPGASYALEAYKSNRWLIRNISTGAIVAYPGIELSQVAASWLRFECGEDGQQVMSLADFGQLVMDAEARILAALTTHEAGPAMV